MKIAKHLLSVPDIYPQILLLFAVILLLFPQWALPIWVFFLWLIVLLINILKIRRLRLLENPLVLLLVEIFVPS